MSQNTQKQDQLRLRITMALKSRKLEVTEDAIANVAEIMEKRNADPVQAIDFMLGGQNPGDGTPGELNPVEGMFRATLPQLNRLAQAASDANTQYAMREALRMTAAKLAMLPEEALGGDDFFRAGDCAMQLATGDLYRRSMVEVEVTPPRLVLGGGEEQKRLQAGG